MRRLNKAWRWLGPVLLLVAVLGLVDWQVHRTGHISILTPLNETNKPPAISSVNGRYLFNGTVVWARAVEKYSRGDYAQPFSQLDSFNRAAYDAWSTDFECPITNNSVPYDTQVNNLIFNCRPEFLPYATKYFSLFDLANNHTDNQGGIAGLSSTRKYLDQAGVQYYGSFDPSVSADTCEVIALPVRLKKADNSEQKASLPVAFCAWHYFNRPDVRPGELESMDKYARVMPVFAFVEMGAEYHAQALPGQVAIAHAIMDRGPEFLLANNPHWVQNTEVYRGKLIVYSMGNFIFDQLDTETQRSASIDVTLSVNYDDNAAKWLALGDECFVFHDNCLQKALDMKLSKVKLNLKYGVVAGQGGAGKVTHKADAATQAAVLERLNWPQTCAQLGYNACR